MTTLRKMFDGTALAITGGAGVLGSGAAAAGLVLTADGLGGASWEEPTGGTTVADGIIVTARDAGGMATAVTHCGTTVYTSQYRNASGTSGPFVKLAAITFRDAVTSIQSFAFPFCASLLAVDIPVGVTTLGNCTFQLCTALTTVNAPGVTVTNPAVPSNATFDRDTALTSVTLGSVGHPVTSITASTFYGCTQAGLTITLYVTPGAQPLANAPWGATSATIVYKSAVDGSTL